jgi:hypothetical protein
MGSCRNIVRYYIKPKLPWLIVLLTATLPSVSWQRACCYRARRTIVHLREHRAAEHAVLRAVVRAQKGAGDGAGDVSATLSTANFQVSTHLDRKHRVSKEPRRGLTRCPR